MQEGISLQQVLSYLFVTVPIILAGIIFINSSIFREGNKIKIASELNILVGPLTQHRTWMSVLCPFYVMRLVKETLCLWQY